MPDSSPVTNRTILNRNSPTLPEGAEDKDEAGGKKSEKLKTSSQASCPSGFSVFNQQALSPFEVER